VRWWDSAGVIVAAVGVCVCGEVALWLAAGVPTTKAPGDGDGGATAAAPPRYPLLLLLLLLLLATRSCVRPERERLAPGRKAADGTGLRKGLARGGAKSVRSAAGGGGKPTAGDGDAAAGAARRVLREGKERSWSSTGPASSPAA